MTNRQFIKPIVERKKRYENIYTPIFYKAIQRTKAPVLKVAKEQGVLTALTATRLITGEHFKAAAISLYTTIGPKEAKWLYKELNKTKDVKAGFGFDFNFFTDIVDFLNRKILDKLVTELTETTRNRIYRTIVDGTRDGDSYDEIIKRLEDTELDKSRARLIARTETNRAVNAGHDMGRKAYPYEVDKIWLSARDRRTRGADGEDKADHFHMNEQTVGEEEAFTDHRSNIQLMYPGDSSLGAQAADVCNCFLPNELTSVDVSRIKKAFRSWYDGEVITVKTAYGNSFTCTPNHPILTSRGWISAKEITQSDKIINSKVIKSFSPDYKVNNTPSTFKEIYNSFSYNGFTVRKKGVIMDFYGDGTDTGYVDIVSANSKLHNGAKVFKSIKNGLLVFSHFAKAKLFPNSSQRKSFSSLFFSAISHPIVSACNKFQSFFMAGLLHPVIHAFAPVTGGNAGIFQSPSDNLPRTIVFLGKSFDRETGIIKGHDFIDGFGCSQVQEISHSFYEGHVYTFETMDGLYDINSYVTKNCRCNVRFNPKRDANGRLILRQNRIIIPM